MHPLLKIRSAKIEALDLTFRERPPLEAYYEPPAAPQDRSHMEKYADIAKAIGFSHPHIESDLEVESFKAFLRQKDWSIFSLDTVIKYMDEKAKEESEAQAGWHWRPLREKDDISEVEFGRKAFRRDTYVQSASDHYQGPHFVYQDVWNNSRQNSQSERVPASASAAPYDKLVPLHALRKVAAIETEYRKPVSFFVCDYAPAPHIEYPDPFLMAVVNNARLSKGVGRFVIDFWDEPGFGLDKQLA